MKNASLLALILLSIAHFSCTKEKEDTISTLSLKGEWVSTAIWNENAGWTSYQEGGNSWIVFSNGNKFTWYNQCPPVQQGEYKVTDNQLKLMSPQQPDVIMHIESFQQDHLRLSTRNSGAEVKYTFIRSR